MKYLSLLLIIFFPSMAYAGAGFFDVSGTDKSIEYLGQIFGQMGSLPIPALGNRLVSDMVYVLNQVIFALGIVIVIWTTMVSTISTAQEGEVLGKKWSTIWIPVRTGAGIFLLVPIVGGYNYIQITVMWFILQGIGAANAIWDVVLYNYDTGESITATYDANELVKTEGLPQLVRAIMVAQLCQEELNEKATDPAYSSMFNGEVITRFRWGNQVMWGIESTKSPVCGAVTLPNVGPSTTASEIACQMDPNCTPSHGNSSKDKLDIALSSIEPTVQISALEVYESNNQVDWIGINNLRYAMTDMRNAINSISVDGRTSTQMDDVSAGARQDGWIHAGSYYFKLVAANTESAMPTQVSFPLQEMDLNSLLGDSMGNSMENDINNRVNAYFLYAVDQMNQDQVRSEQFAMDDNRATLSQEAGQIYDILLGWTKDIPSALGDALTTSGAQEDPLVSIGRVGGYIVFSVEIGFYGAIAASFIAFLVFSPMECINPLPNTSQAILGLLIPLVTVALTFLWVMGLTMAVYIPLIPWLVFTFTAIGWLLLVVEAVLAAPLIALTLLVPSEDEIGKAGHAMVILLGLFLRPALMITGFVLAIKLLTVAIKMLNYGFGEYLSSSLYMFGLFGSLALFIIYVGIVTTIVHECFALIYMLPDKALRWMGGQPEGDDVMGKVRKAEQSTAKAGGVTKGMMGGALGRAHKASSAGGKKGGGMSL